MVLKYLTLRACRTAQRYTNNENELYLTLTIYVQCNYLCRVIYVSLSTNLMNTWTLTGNYHELAYMPSNEKKAIIDDHEEFEQAQSEW